MAEAALYSNFAEPSFPFDLVVPKLTWLPEYLAAVDLESANEKHSPLVALLDVVLVFARGRTSALYHMEYFQTCQSFVSLLNAQLEEVGGAAIRNRLELVRRGPALFFVTCEQSPRFNWRTHLTHLDIGRNLDYFAAGHIFVPPHPPRTIHQFIERSSMKRISSEFMLLDAITDEKMKGEMHRFNKAKENLFNYVMQRLALPYRFKWVMITPHQAERVSIVMSNNTPPGQEWWEENCVYACGAGIPGVPTELELFDFSSQFDKYWPLIQYTYNFLPIFYKVPCDPEYWGEETMIFNEIRRALSQCVVSEKSVIDDFKVQLEALLESRIRRAQLKRARSACDSNVGTLNRWLNRVGYILRLIWEETKLYCFERWKMRQPLVYEGVYNAPGSKAYDFLF